MSFIRTLRGILMTINTQRIGSLVRQLLALLGLVTAIVTQSDSSLHLPVAVSTAIALVSGILLSIEHYVSDPSTGTPTTVATPASTPVGTPPPTIPPTVAP